LGKDLTIGKEYIMLERKQYVARKKHEEKEGKSTCKRNINVEKRHASLYMIGLWVLIDCNDYNLIK
jgi:hypothetical protein